LWARGFEQDCIIGKRGLRLAKILQSHEWRVTTEIFSKRRKICPAWWHFWGWVPQSVWISDDIWFANVTRRGCISQSAKQKNKETRVESVDFAFLKSCFWWCGYSFGFQKLKSPQRVDFEDWSSFQLAIIRHRLDLTCTDIAPSAKILVCWFMWSQVLPKQFLLRRYCSLIVASEYQSRDIPVPVLFFTLIKIVTRQKVGEQWIVREQLGEMSASQVLLNKFVWCREMHQ